MGGLGPQDTSSALGTCAQRHASPQRASMTGAPITQWTCSAFNLSLQRRCRTGKATGEHGRAREPSVRYALVADEEWQVFFFKKIYVYVYIYAHVYVYIY